MARNMGRILIAISLWHDGGQSCAAYERRAPQGLATSPAVCLSVRLSVMSVSHQDSRPALLGVVQHWQPYSASRRLRPWSMTGKSLRCTPLLSKFTHTHTPSLSRRGCGGIAEALFDRGAEANPDGGGGGGGGGGGPRAE